MAQNENKGRWQLQTAKNRFSQVVDEAVAHGPQIVTRHGKETAVVISFEHYLRLVGRAKPTKSFTEFLLSIPKGADELSVDRDRDVGRHVDL